MTDESQPFAGLAVLDLSTGVPAAYAARLFAEAGADVVKVEGPSGDPLRSLAPVGFATWNRSKASLTLDLTDPADQLRMHGLAARADVLLHDLTPSRAAQLGLDEPTCSSRHPHLIVGSVTGWPAWHPRREDPAEEILVQAASGVMDEQQGNREGPIFTRMPYATWCAAFLLAGGVAARLVQRARTGVVGNVATSLYQGVLVPTALYWNRSDRIPDVLDQPHTLPKLWPGATLSLFECGDGVWIQLAGALGGWIESPPVLEQLALADALELSDAGVTLPNLPRWQDIFRRQDSATWFAAFNEVDVPCMLVRDLGDCFSDDQVRVNDYVAQVHDPDFGTMTQVAAPFTLTPPSRVFMPEPFDADSFGRAEHVCTTRANDSTRSPLDGVTVLDLGSMIAAPFASQCLADFGARVVKVERLEGDPGRALTQFAGANRNKLSLSVDLKHPTAADVLSRLIAGADIVVHNIRAGAARRLGLDADSLAAVNPSVVHAHVSANGARGAMSGYPGYDPTAQAMTGWERMNVGAGQQPMWMRNSVLDVGGGLSTFVGSLFQLYRRETSGQAGPCGASLLSVGLAFASETALDSDGKTFPTPQVDPDQTGTSDYHRIYRTRTGWVALVASTDAQRHALLEEFGDDLEAGFSAVEGSVALARLAGCDVPATAVLEDQMHAFFDDASNAEHGLARRLDGSDYGQVEVVGGFWTLLDRATDTKEFIPSLGSHNEEILTDLGYTPEQILALVEAGAVSAPTS